MFIHSNVMYGIFSFLGASISAKISIDERETTQLVLEIVQVAENNGLKLPREFGLLLKQVGTESSRGTIISLKSFYLQYV